ncbi:MAG: hypothetical protein QRY74_03485 [Chlamydia sp.]
MSTSTIELMPISSYNHTDGASTETSAAKNKPKRECIFPLATTGLIISVAGAALAGVVAWLSESSITTRIIASVVTAGSGVSAITIGSALFYLKKWKPNKDLEQISTSLETTSTNLDHTQKDFEEKLLKLESAKKILEHELEKQKQDLESANSTIQEKINEIIVLTKNITEFNETLQKTKDLVKEWKTGVDSIAIQIKQCDGTEIEDQVNRLSGEIKKASNTEKNLHSHIDEIQEVLEELHTLDKSWNVMLKEIEKIPPLLGNGADENTSLLAIANEDIKKLQDQVNQLQNIDRNIQENINKLTQLDSKHNDSRDRLTAALKMLITANDQRSTPSPQIDEKSSVEKNGTIV